MQTILAIDDELSVRESYRLTLNEDYRVLTAASGAEGLATLAEKYVDLVLLDLTMPVMSGLDFLAALRDRGETTPVIVVTGSNTVEMAVGAMKAGAVDFVMKPFDVEDLLALVSRVIEAQRSRIELASRHEADRLGFESIIGQSPALMEALSMARQAMQVDSTVLITGETGTGKDVLARAIHFGSRRAERPFVPLCCSAIPDALVESELFGHVRGAFTGAVEARAGKMQIADGGTLFLDEIGEMPVDAQAKLLRVLQDGAFYPVGGVKEMQVDVRFICATNRNFSKAISEGRIREDLYYRINVLPIHLPPLRSRREDIAPLVAHFVAKHAPRVNAQAHEFAPGALAAMAAHDWPGNIRELENTVERALVCNNSAGQITADMVTRILPQGSELQRERLREQGAGGLVDFEGLPLDEATARLERHLIMHALEQSNYVQSHAADRLGTTRRILKYKMDQLGMAEDGGDARSSMAS
jgi:DNA-binding NtrC family response regulator